MGVAAVLLYFKPDTTCVFFQFGCPEEYAATDLSCPQHSNLGHTRSRQANGREGHYAFLHSLTRWPVKDRRHPQCISNLDLLSSILLLLTLHLMFMLLSAASTLACLSGCHHALRPPPFAEFTSCSCLMPLNLSYNGKLHNVNSYSSTRLKFPHKPVTNNANAPFAQKVCP